MGGEDQGLEASSALCTDHNKVEPAGLAVPTWDAGSAGGDVANYCKPRNLGFQVKNITTSTTEANKLNIFLQGKPERKNQKRTKVMEGGASTAGWPPWGMFTNTSFNSE